MIRALIETSLIDWDGKLAMVLFFDRCNFLCPFCQNWELIRHPERFPEITWDNIFKKLQKKKKWVDGVVFTGGEPFIYFKDVLKYANLLKTAGFGVKIDTHGGFPDKLKELIRTNLVDYIAMDIKAPLDGSYLKAVGKTASGKNEVLVDRIKKSITILMAGGVDFEFRTTCVPGIIDAAAIRKIGEQIRGTKRWFLQAYVPNNAYRPEYRTYTFKLSELKSLLTIARRYVPGACLRGGRE